MKSLLLIIFLSFFTTINHNPMILEKIILNEFDNAYRGTPSSNYNGKYANDFPTLEHGYLMVATPKIHLYRQENLWGVVFELPGLDVKQDIATSYLYYFGNNIEFSHSTELENNVIMEHPLNLGIDEGSEDYAITAKDSDNNDLKYSLDSLEYENMGIFDKFNEIEHTIDLEEIFLYFAEKHPEMVELTDEKIESHFKSSMTKILTITSFHHVSVEQVSFLPSTHETFQLIAKVISENDPSLWKPTLAPNNHWSNWMNGHM